MSITWTERVANLRKALGRGRTMGELLDVATIHRLTPAEIDAQRESWARGMAPCVHGVGDLRNAPSAGTRGSLSDSHEIGARNVWRLEAN